MDNLKQLNQDALNSGRILGAVVFSDGTVLTKSGSVVQPPLGPIVKPAVLATSGDLTLYADWSIGSAAMDAYNAGYKGPGYTCYGFFPSDALAVFPQFANDPGFAGSAAYNQAQLYGPFGQISEFQQGCNATLAPDGHGYVHGSVHAVRGTLATKYKAGDLAGLAALWSRSGFYPVQVEQGASGKPFP